MHFRKTPAAAQELGINYASLIGLLRYGKLEPPAKDTSGDYVWTDADLARARRAMAAHQRKRPEPVTT
jgi:hypothetical protein